MAPWSRWRWTFCGFTAVSAWEVHENCSLWGCCFPFLLRTMLSLFNIVNFLTSVFTQCAGGGGLEKVPILKQLLHFSGQSDGGEWWSNECPHFLNILGSIYGQKVVFLAPFMAKNAISGHELPWGPQMAGSRWIKVGSSQVTPGPMCWNLFSFLKLPSGGSRRAQNSPKLP